MHYCGIIIKPKSMSVGQARELLGDYLVEQGVSDWYSSDGYRERTFEGGKQTISIDKFASFFSESWLSKLSELTPEDKFVFNDAWAFGVIEDDYLDQVFVPRSFWEFYDLDPLYRRDLINAYIRAYKAATEKLLKDLLAKDSEEYEVVLLDYHN